MAVGGPFSRYRQLQVTSAWNKGSTPSLQLFWYSHQHLSPSFLLQSQGFRTRGSGTSSLHQPQPLLDTKATVTDARVALVPASHGWFFWEMACITSQMGWP